MLKDKHVDRGPTWYVTYCIGVALRLLGTWNNTQWHEFQILLPSPNRALYTQQCIYSFKTKYLYLTGLSSICLVWCLCACYEDLKSVKVLDFYVSVNINKFFEITIVFLNSVKCKTWLLWHGCIYEMFSTVNSVDFSWALFFIFKQSSQNFDRFRFKSKVLGKKRKGGKWYLLLCIVCCVWININTLMSHGCHFQYFMREN